MIRSHDIDVVDLYSDLAILAVTGNVGGLKGYIGIGTTIGEPRPVGGVPMFGNAIGEFEGPNVGVGEVTVLFVKIVLLFVRRLLMLPLKRRK